MNAIRLLPVLYFAAHGSALGGTSELCTWEPMLPVKAGSDISVKIQNPWGDECRAELEFSDDKFPKMAWLFKATDCVDLQLAEFKVPSGAPNGDAYLTWQCDGDVPMSCIHIVISNGKGDLVSPTPRPKTETARCVPSTTLLTHTASRGGEKPTGVFLDTRSFNPTAATALSTPASEALDSATTTPVATDVSAPTTSTKSWVNTPSFNSLVGTGGTRKAGETSAQLPTDTSTPATPATNTAPVTTTIADLVTTPIGGSITTTTTTITTEDDSANEPSYVTVTATIATCPATMREHA
ncbi:hypothetical protein B0J13DRAFT_547235 [Dactylonectria estremocensis]|uniref:Uncharacterized protein n=1 Tax=Dactylonectria estremocensis TaxID=1079267 RepID=A0A9P9JA05_9HYPO|nr:hypothetical protein B0J13DRAFT_547235 [Dactylonectria estremocensis]